jgi:DNA-binding Lrp family transcriptional regulator
MISNALLRDSALSLKARGLAAWLWSHSAEFALSVERIAEQTNTGLTAVRTAVKELEDHGYLTRTRERDSNNRTTGMVYNLYEKPEPPSGNPPVENPPVENVRDYKKTNSKKINVKKNNNKSAAAGDAPAEPEGLFPSQDALREALGMDTTARDVVAAYVDSYKAGHQDHPPLQADIGKIAGQAARLIKDPAVEAKILLQAATALGRTQFTDLSGQYRRQTQSGNGNDNPTRGYFRAEQKNEFVPPVGETTEQANARVQAHMDWLAKYNAGTATLADKPRS